MISWFDFQGRGYISAYISISSLKIWKRIDFLVDTGSTKTILNPRDTMDLGLDIESMEKVIGYGFGGKIQLFRLKNVSINIIFIREKREDKNLFTKLNEVYFLPVNETSIYIKDSILGLDVINNFDLFFSQIKERIEFSYKK